MLVLKMRSSYRFYTFMLIVLLLTSTFSGLAFPAVLAAEGDLTIKGDGLNNPEGITITQAQLQGIEELPDKLQALSGWDYLPQHDERYSTINTWPIKSWYRGVGVKLIDLLELAGGFNENATLIRFTARDGFKATFTVQELLYEDMYRFPNFMDTGLEGHLPGDSSDAVSVEPIIAHRSFSAQNLAELEKDENFSLSDANQLLFGQRAVTQQTNARFVKYVVQIEVLTEDLPQWDKPRASVPSGPVKIGTKVELHGPFDDEDKVHYTLDGSEPTIESPMYNWIARRWWNSRGEQKVAEINKPIEITRDTVIKAITIGPGKKDSEVATFTYEVIESESGEDGIDEERERIFTDIIGHWAEEGIKKMIDRGVVSGYPDGTFKPDNKITRAEFISILINAFKLSPEAGKVFADTANHWARENISTAAYHGIVSGYDDNSFRPDNPINREQMAVMIVGAMKLTNGSQELSFVDSSSISSWARGAVASAVKKGIMKGYSDNTLRPKGNATRAEAITVIVNALEQL